MRMKFSETKIEKVLQNVTCFTGIFFVNNIFSRKYRETF
jgi:ABC-type uncharacterized transport system permease subunit